MKVRQYILIAGATCLIWLILGALYFVYAWYMQENVRPRYLENNATWEINGLCLDQLDGSPVSGATITAVFRQAHPYRELRGFDRINWFKRDKRDYASLPVHEVIQITDEVGRFKVIGNGGYCFVKATADNYISSGSKNLWSYTARGETHRVATNIVLYLVPKHGTAVQKAKSISPIK